jgi:hypothetical protein
VKSLPSLRKRGRVSGGRRAQVWARKEGKDGQGKRVSIREEGDKVVSRDYLSGGNEDAIADCCDHGQRKEVFPSSFPIQILWSKGKSVYVLLEIGLGGEQRKQCVGQG